MSKRQPRWTKTRGQASIVNGSIYFEDARQCSLYDEIAPEILEDATLTAIRVISLSNDWIEQVWYKANVMTVESINMEMTLRKEKRGALYHWYAYRRVFGKLHKRYVGHSDEITEAKLVKIAHSMPTK